MGRLRAAGWSCLLTLGGWLAASAAGATIVPTFAERSVFADAEAVAPPQTSSQANGDGGGGFENLGVSVEAAATTDGATSSAGARQSSRIQPSLIDASSNADAQAMSFVDDGLSDSTGDSLFLITFEVSEAGPYRLSGVVASLGDGGAALVSFDEASSSGQPIFRAEVQGDDFSGFLENFDLVPGVSYEILAIASAEADALGTGSGEVSEAAFDFGFFLVPEPASAALLALGLTGLSALAARRRSPRPR